MVTDQERRNYKRKSQAGDVKFSVIGVMVQSDFLPTTAEAELCDLSDTGAGLCTETALKPGQLIKFTDKKTVNNLPEMGIVMWTMKNEAGFKAGVKFV